MSKILKNQTGSPISIGDTGVSVPASPYTYTIPSTDYLLWAASSDIVVEVGNGTIIVNDGSTDLSISDGIDLIKGIFPSAVNIKGNTDGTKIGNSGDRLKVDAVVSAPASPSVWSSKLRYEDMGITSGGVNRDTLIDTNWTQVYSYSSTSGLLSNFTINLEDIKKWRVRVVVDSEELYGSNGILTSDMESDNLYGLHYNDANDGYVAGTGINFYIGSNDTINWGGPLCYPIKFASSIHIYVRRITGESSKKFKAGLAILQKG